MKIFLFKKRCKPPLHNLWEPRLTISLGFQSKWWFVKKPYFHWYIRPEWVGISVNFMGVWIEAHWFRNNY